MYDNLRLTELHEEWAWKTYCAVAKEVTGEESRPLRAEVKRLDAEIRARVARQEIGPATEDTDFGPIYVPPEADSYDLLLVCDVTGAGYRPWPHLLLPQQLYVEKVARPVVVFPLRSTERLEIEPAQKLKHGSPDAERVYPRRGNTVRTYGEPRGAAPAWIHHAQHALPVEGCHLCREASRV